MGAEALLRVLRAVGFPDDKGVLLIEVTVSHLNGVL